MRVRRPVEHRRGWARRDVERGSERAAEVARVYDQLEDALGVVVERILPRSRQPARMPSSRLDRRLLPRDPGDGGDGQLIVAERGREAGRALGEDPLASVSALATRVVELVGSPWKAPSC